MFVCLLVVVLLCAVFCSAGARVGVYSGNVNLLFEDIAIAKPTLFFGVPRVYNRIVDGVKKKVYEKGLVTRQLFNLALNTKVAGLRSNGSFTHSFYDKLIFNKVKQEVFGGRVRFFACSASAIDPEYECFIQVSFLSLQVSLCLFYTFD